MNSEERVLSADEQAVLDSINKKSNEVLEKYTAPEEEKAVEPIAAGTEKVAIPPEARAEIFRLYQEVDALYAEFTAAREAFHSFLLETKKALGIPENEPWDIDKDGTFFTKLQIDFSKLRGR